MIAAFVRALDGCLYPQLNFVSWRMSYFLPDRREHFSLIVLFILYLYLYCCDHHNTVLYSQYYYCCITHADDANKPHLPLFFVAYDGTMACSDTMRYAHFLFRFAQASRHGLGGSAESDYVVATPVVVVVFVYVFFFSSRPIIAWFKHS